MSLGHKDIAVVSGLMISLAGATFSTPQMIIRRLAGALFSDDEAEILLGAVAAMDPVFSGVIDDMIQSSRAKKP